MDKLIEDTRPCQYSNTVFFEFVCVGETKYINESELISISSLAKSGGNNLQISVRTLYGEFLAKGKLCDYEDLYAKYLLRPNRSILVNSRYVVGIKSEKLCLFDNTVIYMSRGKAPEIKEQMRKRIRLSIKKMRFSVQIVRFTIIYCMTNYSMIRLYYK